MYDKKNTIRSSYYNPFLEFSIDSLSIDKCFTNDDALFTSEKDPEIDQEKINKIKGIIEYQLPEFEKYAILLFFFYKKNEASIGKILHISQVMVNYFKNRGLKRLSYLLFLNSIDTKDMEFFLKKHVTIKQENAMLEYFKVHDLRKILPTINSIENSKIMTYNAIGNRIKLGIKKLKFLKNSSDKIIADKAELYYKTFLLLKEHNSIRTSQTKKTIPFELEQL